MEIKVSPPGSTVVPDNPAGSFNEWAKYIATATEPKQLTEENAQRL
jgi:hypothetical protein